MDVRALARGAIATAILLARGRASLAADPPGHQGALGPYAMTREASGTSWQPEATEMEGRHDGLGSWRIMAHADAFFVFTRQGGPRGRGQAFSTHMLLGAGSRAAGGGLLTFRGMGSTEPLMGPSGYR